MSDITILRERARIVREIRRFFDEQDFVEVETAVRIPAPAPEEHIDCPVVLGQPPSVADGAAKEGVTYLRASPEIQMKKLLAAGMDRIYQIGPCFREGERGARHNPEFTMLEWYRKGATYLDIMDDFERLLMSFSCSSFITHCSSFGKLRVCEAYAKFAGWDPWQGEWDQDRFDFDMAMKIEPAIKQLGGGIFLMDYPPQAAALSKLRGEVAERWEFYYNGIELANCFTELCDSDEQRKRFQVAKEARKALNEADYPIDNDFLACLPQVGDAAGVALGIDRLVMVLTETEEIPAVRADI